MSIGTRSQGRLRERSKRTFRGRRNRRSRGAVGCPVAPPGGGRAGPRGHAGRDPPGPDPAAAEPGQDGGAGGAGGALRRRHAHRHAGVRPRYLALHQGPDRRGHALPEPHGLHPDPRQDARRDRGAGPGGGRRGRRRRLGRGVDDVPGGVAALAPREGRIPIAAIASLQPSAAASATVHQAVEVFQATGKPWVIGPVAHAQAAFGPPLRGLDASLASMASLVEALPDLLGADATKRYFVAAQNPAELRGTGGPSRSRSARSRLRRSPCTGGRSPGWGAGRGPARWAGW